MDELPDVDPAPAADLGSVDRASGAGRVKGGSRPGRRRGDRPEPGTALNEIVEESGPLSVDEVQALGSALASELTRLHTLGTAHGDIRPATVLRTPKGPQLAEGDPFRQAAIVNDSLFFVAPELLENPADVSPATDVYALGAVLAFAATGASPLGSRPVTQPVRESERPDLSAVPKELRRVVERCLDRNPAARPSAIALSILLGARLEEVPTPVVPVLVTPAAAHADTDIVATLDDDRRPRHLKAAVGAVTLAAAVVAFLGMGVSGDGSQTHDHAVAGAVNGATSASITTPPHAALPPHGKAFALEPDVPATSSVSASVSSVPPASPPASPPRLLKSPAPSVTWTGTSSGRPVALDNRTGSAPAPPGVPSVTSGYVMTVDVRWAPAVGATRYEVSYTGSVSGAMTVTTTGTATTLKGLFPSERLCAKVRAVNQFGASAWVSGSACVMVI